MAHAVSPESADVVRQQSITEIAHHYGLSWSTVMAVVTAWSQRVGEHRRGLAVVRHRDFRTDFPHTPE